MQRAAFLALAAALATACTGERSAPEADVRITVTDVGFETPESVVHDTASDVYLVSNINGSPLTKDDNGFIAQLGPDGSIAALRWIDGARDDVTLHAPKGMALRGDTLFVADIDAVRLFDRRTGAPAGSWTVPGATFLNDVAVGPDGRVYATDSGLRATAEGFEASGSDALYRFEDDGTPVALTRGEALGLPNGIVVDDDRILLVSFGSGSVFLIDVETGQTSGLPRPAEGQLDGVVRIGEGTYLMSSWAGRAIYRLGAGGQYTIQIDSVEAPADIGFDAARRRVLVPLFTTNRVLIAPLDTP